MTADQSYKAQLQRAENAIRMIRIVLNEHKKRQRKDKSNWGFSGEMSHFATQLDETAQLIDGEENPETEEISPAVLTEHKRKHGLSEEKCTCAKGSRFVARNCKALDHID